MNWWMYAKTPAETSPADILAIAPAAVARRQYSAESSGTAKVASITPMPIHISHASISGGLMARRSDTAAARNTQI